MEATFKAGSDDLCAARASGKSHALCLVWRLSPQCPQTCPKPMPLGWLQPGGGAASREQPRAARPPSQGHAGAGQPSGRTKHQGHPSCKAWGGESTARATSAEMAGEPAQSTPGPCCNRHTLAVLKPPHRPSQPCQAAWCNVTRAQPVHAASPSLSHRVISSGHVQSSSLAGASGLLQSPPVGRCEQGLRSASFPLPPVQ